MWGRITQIAEQLDGNFGDDSNNDDRRASSSNLSSPSSQQNGDGWDDTDDFDDELDFDGTDNNDEVDALDGEEDTDAIGTSGETEGGGGDAWNDDDDAFGGLNEDSLDEDVGDLCTGQNDAIAINLPNKVEFKTALEVKESEPAASTTPSGSVTLDVNIDAATPPPTTNGTINISTSDINVAQSPVISNPSTVTVSAPGKVLIAGGYLVLESPNPGVVLAAKGCRFHTTVMFRQPFNIGVGDTLGSNAVGMESIPLDVYSPQFDKVFSYRLSYLLGSQDDDDVAIRLQPRHPETHTSNKFVERSLLLALSYIQQSIGLQEFHSKLRQPDDNGGALAIKLRADNDFYSQITHLKQRGLDLTPKNIESLEPFLPCPKDEMGNLVVNKTGLGSSAALVTSLVGALLSFFDVVSLPVTKDDGTNSNNKELHEEGLRIAHNLSQICHCHAQGKVGSGFDVSSAVYGSHIYTRFSENVINRFLESVDAQKGFEGGLDLTGILSQQLRELVNDTTKKWDCTVTPISLPQGLELLMADICGGSESPSMAKKILEWKKNNRKVGFLDDYYWKDLKRCNNKIVSLLSNQLASQTVLKGLQRDGPVILASRTAEQWKKPMPSSWHEFEGSSWDIAGKLLDLRMAFMESRQNLKGMGKAADVPVEPDEQTNLANATMKLPGVVASGVPGAGGYDALFVVYVKGTVTCVDKSDSVRDNIANLWRDFSNQNDTTVVCPLSVKAAGFGGENGLCASALRW